MEFAAVLFGPMFGLCYWPSLFPRECFVVAIQFLKKKIWGVCKKILSSFQFLARLVSCNFYLMDWLVASVSYVLFVKMYYFLVISETTLRQFFILDVSKAILRFMHLSSCMQVKSSLGIFVAPSWFRCPEFLYYCSLLITLNLPINLHFSGWHIWHWSGIFLSYSSIEHGRLLFIVEVTSGAESYALHRTNESPTVSLVVESNESCNFLSPNCPSVKCLIIVCLIFVFTWIMIDFSVAILLLSRCSAELYVVLHVYFLWNFMIS